MAWNSDGRYVVVVNSGGTVACSGTTAGRPFASERAANQAAQRLERDHPMWQALVLRIEADPTVKASTFDD